MSGGRVTLAGAGPGDPGLITVAASEAIAKADVILHDQLIPHAALLSASPDAELINVGKIGGGKQVPQDETNRLIVEHAKAGRAVLRLKGGDPFVFGRGGEEAQLCREHDIPFEVIPGITAGIAAPAYAGIPVTHRGLSTSVAFITGHETPGKPGSQFDWPAMARFPGTIIIYMGTRRLQRICDQLIAAGRPADQPVAVVERATFPDQRTVHGTLATIAERAQAVSVAAPTIIVIGDVAALGEQIAWRGAGPLAGLSIVVTRPKAQASGLASDLQAQGARVIEAPVIKPQPLDFTLPTDLDAFDLVVFSSPNGVDSCFRGLHADGLDARAFANARVAVIGPGTASALAARGINADLVPSRAVGESLAELLAGTETRAALIIRARGGRDVVDRALRETGTTRIDVVEPYVTVAERLDERTAAKVLAADWATLTSASSARALCDAVGGAGAIAASGLKLASIGPITSAALAELGLTPALEAGEHTPAGLVAALSQER